LEVLLLAEERVEEEDEEDDVVVGCLWSFLFLFTDDSVVILHDLPAVRTDAKNPGLRISPLLVRLRKEKPIISYY
jgi:hypothetical protein